MPPLRPLNRYLAWLFIALPIVGVGVAIGFYAINLPYWDDYVVTEHLAMLKAQRSLPERISHLFDQHWEHRIVFTRLIFAGYYLLARSLNYVGLTFIGYSGLVVLIALLLGAFRRLGLPLVFFIPVPYWLFCFESHENLLWAMASIQNFWLIVLAIGTFYALAINRIAVALAAAVVATYTSGNGSLVMMAGLFVLLWQRTWTWAAIWAALSVVAVGGYFYQYQRITFFPSPYLYPVTDWVKAFFVFFGGFLDPYPYMGKMAIGYVSPFGPVMILGLLLVVALHYMGLTIVRQKWATMATSREDAFWSLFFLGTAFFLLTTAAVTVYGRVGFAGPGYLLQSRYKIYSGLSLAVIYLSALWVWRKAAWLPRFGWSVGISTVLFSSWASYLCLEGLVNQQRRTVAEYISWRLATPKSVQEGTKYVYTPPKLPLIDSAVKQLSGEQLKRIPLLAGTTLAIHEEPPLYNIPINESQNPTLTQPLLGTYLVIADSANTYVVAARPLRPAPFAISGAYFKPDQALAQVLKEKLKPGKYRLGRLTSLNGGLTMGMSETLLTFTGQ